jgi:hypothetical protein
MALSDGTAIVTEVGIAGKSVPPNDDLHASGQAVDCQDAPLVGGETVQYALQSCQRSTSDAYCVTNFKRFIAGPCPYRQGFGHQSSRSWMGKLLSRQ